jgi:hypothetical protein
MAKRKTRKSVSRSRRTSSRRASPRRASLRRTSVRSSGVTKSKISRTEFALNNHDEEKLLLLVAGILLGVGISVSLFFNQLWYGGLVAIALGVVFMMIENRQ